MDKTSSKRSGECSRKGTVWLRTGTQGSVILPTRCKTWKCVVCRVGRLNYFRLKVQVGCSRLEQSAFITITYQADAQRGDPAEYVPSDWKALKRLLRSNEPQISRMKWIRVMELTQRKVPHHHLIMEVPNGMAVKCWRGRRLDTQAYLSRRPSCQCMAHRISRQWFIVTGDSFIVHSGPILGASWAADYLAKYLEKAFHYREATGMERRWSTSREWPGIKRVRLAGTAINAWSHIQVSEHVTEDSLMELSWKGKEALLIRVGDPHDMKAVLELEAVADRNRKEKALAKAYSSQV